MAANSICSPWIAGPYNMHATALGALIEWGRVHEVRHPSMPKLGVLIQYSGVSAPAYRGRYGQSQGAAWLCGFANAFPGRSLNRLSCVKSGGSACCQPCLSACDEVNMMFIWRSMLLFISVYFYVQQAKKNRPTGRFHEEGWATRELKTRTPYRLLGSRRRQAAPLYIPRRDDLLG